MGLEPLNGNGLLRIALLLAGPNGAPAGLDGWWCDNDSRVSGNCRARIDPFTCMLRLLAININKHRRRITVNKSLVVGLSVE